MFWIFARKGEDIPKELLYTGYKTDKDKDGDTPLMLWISCRKSEAIPDILLDDAL